MKYVLFFLISSTAYAGGMDLQSVLLPLLMQKMQQQQQQQQPQSTTIYYGGGNPDQSFPNMRHYLGDEYLESKGVNVPRKSNTRTLAKTLQPEQIVKLLKLYPNATLLIQRAAGEPMPQSVILLLEK